MLEVLDDGLLRFKIRNSATGEQTEHAIDVLLLRLTCEECETTHRLQTNDSGAYIATAAFLTDLAAKLESQGVTGCTPSVARQLWVAGAARLDELQKKTDETPSSPSGSQSIPVA